MAAEMSPTVAQILAVVLLVASCFVMTAAWYLHLNFKARPMWQAILFSWLIAGGEYLLQVPANRIGHGAGQLSAAHLRAIAEVAIIVSFLLFQRFVLLEPVRVNHLLGFTIVLCGVCVVLFGPFHQVLLEGGERGGHRILQEELEGVEEAHMKMETHFQRENSGQKIAPENKSIIHSVSAWKESKLESDVEIRI